MDRIIALIDMDCFYVQVEQRERPETWGKPAAVTQYTGRGVIIAVNYEARPIGVIRGMTRQEAKAKCPELNLFIVPEKHGKSDLDKYRKASAEVFNVICNYNANIVVERASVDEAFLDLTEYVGMADLETATDDLSSIQDVFVEGFAEEDERTSMEVFTESIKASEDDSLMHRQLLIAAKAVKEIRKRIRDMTQFSCTAGISFNKTLAKLACGVKKPDGQTILPPEGVSTLYSRTPIRKVRSLGGKLGHRICQEFGIEMMSELSGLSIETLETVVSKETASWLHAVGQGHDGETVSARQLLKSIGCGKNFVGLKTLSEVKQWIRNLCLDMVKRLTDDRNENNRIAKSMSFHARFKNGKSYSKALPIAQYDVDVLKAEIEKNGLTKMEAKDGSENIESPIVNLSLSACNFVDAAEVEKSAVYKTRKVDSYFKRCDKPSELETVPEEIDLVDDDPDELSNSPTSKSHYFNNYQSRTTPKKDAAVDEMQQEPSEKSVPTKEERKAALARFYKSLRENKPPKVFDISSGFFYRKALEKLQGTAPNDDEQSEEQRGLKRPNES